MILDKDLYRQANGADAPVAHTPAPWRVEAEGIKVGDKDGFQPFGACGCCDSPWMVADSPEVKLADARLIVASPALLAALKACLWCMESDLPPEVTEAERLVAADAIALAIGGAS